MAVGDVINGIGSDNASVTYQPAAGVEAVIFGATTNVSLVGSIALYNGTDGGYAQHTQSDSPALRLKQFINNTNYLLLTANGAGVKRTFWGIQTK